MTHQSKPPVTPIGAVDINGDLYLRNVKGDLVAVANIKPQDLLMHELVYKIAGYAEDLSAEIARFADHTYADMGAFDALLAQEYGVERPAGRGNRQISAFDGAYQVKVKVQDLTTFGPELHIAKDLLDAIIRDRSEGADPFLVTLVGQAFKVGKEGYVDGQAIRALRNLQVDDERWPDVVRAIDDAERVRETKRYVQVYRRDAAGELKLIPLDIASAKVRPEDAARRSLRRQVAEAEDAKAKALETLSVALTHMLDSAMRSAAHCIADAAATLGGDLRGMAVEYSEFLDHLEQRMLQQRAGSAVADASADVSATLAEASASEEG